MNESIIYGFVGSIIALLFMYLDSRFNKNPKTRMTYFKNMLLVGIIVAALFYVTGFGSTTSSIQFGGGGAGGMGNTAMAPGINEAIMTGVPDF